MRALSQQRAGGADRVLWVKFAIAPLAGIGNDMARESAHRVSSTTSSTTDSDRENNDALCVRRTLVEKKRSKR